MQCPRCGGWHYGYGEPPTVNTDTTKHVDPATAENVLSDALDTVASEAKKDPYDRDVLPKGDGKLWEPRVYGTDERDKEVTVAFGKPGTIREDHFMISDSHESGWTFFGGKRSKGHDHGGPDGHTERGSYTGWDSFQDPEADS